MNKAKAARCTFMIEKDWPGHVSVLSRRLCKNKTCDPSNRCHLHGGARRPSKWVQLSPAADGPTGLYHL